MYKFKNLANLCSDLKRNNKSIEQFYISFNNVQFDCILDIGARPFELMIGVLKQNFACTIQIHEGYKSYMSDSDYYKLCEILNLSYKNGGFTSSMFLENIDKHIPQKCSVNLVNPSHLAVFRASQLTKEERDEGFIFCGWLTHSGKNNGHARNFNKTEKLLGKSIADYCRKNDISSKWTNVQSKAVPLSYPW